MKLKLTKASKLKRNRTILLGAGLAMACFTLLFGGANMASADTVIFSNVEATAIKDISTTIIWDTDIAATGQIEYGLTTGYGNTTNEEGLNYWQSIELTNLAAGTTYHYRIKAKDYDNDETTSNDYTFTTRTQAELEALVRAARTNNDLP